MKKQYLYIIIALLILALIIAGLYLFRKNQEYSILVSNRYNLAFYELIDHIKDVEVYLAKSLISTSPEAGNDSLTHVWREANLAAVSIAALPTTTGDFATTSKFLNQVSEYSYSLSRKNNKNESLSEEDFKKLEELHSFALELTNILEQLAVDMQVRKDKLERINSKHKYAICKASR